MKSDVAIVGISMNVPGATSPEVFWNNLIHGVESLTSISNDELVNNGVSKEVLDKGNYVKFGGFIDDVSMFDAEFFGYSAREAEEIDPQQRLLLEHSWMAMEDAGYAKIPRKNSIGVFACTGINTYLINNLLSHERFKDIEKNPLSMLGNASDFVATRIAYKLNCRAQSLTVQSGCSSSLVAIHQARVALLTHQCDIAIVGACSLPAPKKKGYWYAPNGIASPDGKCRPFDKNAQGTVFSNGVMVVVLRRATDAVNNNDNIYGLIKASSTNNDGSLKAGFTAPSVEGQSSVISKALSIGKINPEDIGLVEAHGTATELGDPIEILALTKAYREFTDKKQYCAVGSAKGNIGHLDVATGLAGLIKVVMALKYKKLPPSLNFNVANPKIDFENTPFYVCAKAQEWLPIKNLRLGAVSAFGMGGTNAHVILGEYIGVENESKSDTPQLITISAKNETAVIETKNRLRKFLEEKSPEVSVIDVAYSLQVGRANFPYKQLCICDDQNYLDCGWISGFYNDAKNTLVFMFPGQGSQYVNMAKSLYLRCIIFRKYLDDCCLLFKEHLGENILDFIYPEEDNEASSEMLEQTRLTQPAIFSIEYSLGKFLLDLGLKPDILLGHSIGEYSAACLGGVFTLKEAVLLVSERGRLLGKLNNGGMLAVSISEDKLCKILPKTISIAAINSPISSVISGSNEDLLVFEKTLQEMNVHFRKLRTSAAFHSCLVEPILDEYQNALLKINFSKPQIKIISNVTGTWLTEKQACGSQYWLDHLRKTVRFTTSIRKIQENFKTSVFLEVGPGRTLETLVRQHKFGNSVINSIKLLPHPQEQIDDYRIFLEGVGRLWLSAAILILKKMTDFSGLNNNKNITKNVILCKNLLIFIDKNKHILYFVYFLNNFVRSIIHL